jgi:D-3-phosphoglycerate dehydrogenase / 2-oxoglutarate reductase
VFGTLVSLLRHLPRAFSSMRDGRWDRAELLGHELKGRTLGIVGVGRIGSAVAQRAHAFGMSVIGYDPYIGDDRFRALRVRGVPTLDALLEEADIVTIHTPLNEETRGMVGAGELARLRPGSIIANIARGGIIDEASLLAALESGQLHGAILDVYKTEPLASDHPLRRVPNVVLTPHIGASTAEAQRNVAVEVCRGVRDALLTGELSHSINVAWPGDGRWSDLQPAIVLAERAAVLARALLADRGLRAIRRLSVRLGPELIGGGQLLLSGAVVGTLRDVVETERLNLINARSLAEARGIELAIAELADARFPTSLEVAIGGGTHELAVAGVVGVGAQARLTQIGSFHVDIAPRGTMIVLTNNDVPGVIGRVGTLLGAEGVNIAEYHQARLAQGGEALAAVSVDGPIPAQLRQRLLALPDVVSATIVRFETA